MRYSYNWLKELSGTKLSPEKLADLLTMRSFEVEEIKKVGEGLEKVVVGKILEIKKHPDADRLQVVKVDAGKIEGETRVVCGAFNIKTGDKVPVALAGIKLPNGLQIREAEIRGVKSQGMLCAEDELELGKDHSGILILSKKLKPGTTLSKALRLNDTILDLDILSNRGHDALSHIGIAREICALENRNCEWLRMDKRMNANANRNLIDIKVEDGKLCPRYIGAVMENIEIKESPEWIKSRLVACGFSPINNVVDATNYVMLEMGQPTHAFDFSKVKSVEIPNSKLQITNKFQIQNSKSKKIFIRKAKKGEKIKLLDENIVELNTDDLVIADSEKALAIAGVMGGFDSGVTKETRIIVLESANFNYATIRKTRMRLGLNTESSYRFERELDPNLAEKAMARLMEIISETANGKLKCVKDIYPRKVLPRKIKLDLDYVNKLLGEEIPTEKVVKISELLGLKIKLPLNLPLEKGEGVARVEVPTFRIDLKNQEDLIEEIGRIYGYEKIKPIVPMASVTPAKINEQRMFERKVKSILANGGFSEVYNYSFYSQKDAEAAGLEEAKHLELENPMNPEQALMRISLIPNLLKSIKNNLKNCKEFNIFEIGRVYWPKSEVLPEEKKMLVGAVVKTTNNLRKTTYDKKAESFYLAKGYADSLLSQLGIANQYYDNFKISPEENFESLWHKTRNAEIKIEGQEKTVGHLGEISTLVLEEFGIFQRVAIFEFDVEKIKEISETEREYEPISKYPSITRDISMIVNEGVRVADVLMNIQASGGDLVLDVDLFDIFENEKERAKSLAFHIVFGSAERTLENKEVDKLMEEITTNLEEDLKVRIKK